MIIDEKGRLFSKVSIIDLALVLLLILAIGFVGFKIIGAEGLENVGNSKVEPYEITFKVSGIRQVSVDALEKSVGKPVSDAWSAKLGKLKKIESVEPYKTTAVKDDGTVVEVEMPEKYVVTLVLEVDGIKTDDSIMLENKRKFSIGSSMILSTKEIAAETIITKIIKK